MIKLLLAIHGVYSMYYVWCRSSNEMCSDVWVWNWFKEKPIL